MPGKRDLMPGVLEVMPGKRDRMPGVLEVMPGKRDRMPGVLEVMPGDVVVVPGTLRVGTRGNGLTKRRQSCGGQVGGIRDGQATLDIPDVEGGDEESPH